MVQYSAPSQATLLHWSPLTAHKYNLKAYNRFTQVQKRGWSTTSAENANRGRNVSTQQLLTENVPQQHQHQGTQKNSPAVTCSTVYTSTVQTVQTVQTDDGRRSGGWAFWAPSVYDRKARSRYGSSQVQSVVMTAEQILTSRLQKTKSWQEAQGWGEQPELFEHLQAKNGQIGALTASQVEAVVERLQLLLSQPLLLLQVLLPDEQRGLRLHEAPVVLQLLGGQLSRQEGGDEVLSPVQVILQIFGILPLFAQQTMATVQRLLSAETQEDKQHVVSLEGWIYSLSYTILLRTKKYVCLLLKLFEFMSYRTFRLMWCMEAHYCQKVIKIKMIFQWKCNYEIKS